MVKPSLKSWHFSWLAMLGARTVVSWRFQSIQLNCTEDSSLLLSVLSHTHLETILWFSQEWGPRGWLILSKLNQLLAGALTFFYLYYLLWLPLLWIHVKETVHWGGINLQMQSAFCIAGRHHRPPNRARRSLDNCSPGPAGLSNTNPCFDLGPGIHATTPNQN